MFSVKIQRLRFPISYGISTHYIWKLQCHVGVFSPFYSFSLYFKVPHLFLFPRFIVFCVLRTLHVATCLLKLLFITSSLMVFFLCDVLHLFFLCRLDIERS